MVSNKFRYFRIHLITWHLLDETVAGRVILLKLSPPSSPSPPSDDETIGPHHWISPQCNFHPFGIRNAQSISPRPSNGCHAPRFGYTSYIAQSHLTWITQMRWSQTSSKTIIQQSFHRRIAYCLTMHNDAVRGMRYPLDGYKNQLEVSQGLRGKKDKDKEDKEKVQELKDELDSDY